MKLSRLISSIHQELPVTPRHEKWLLENPNANYSASAKNFLSCEIGKPQRVRTGSFSASSAGICPRRRQFDFLGLPTTTRLNARTVSIFHNGTWTHLRWQMAGMSAGWLARGEVPVENTDLMLKGTMDGVLDTGEGLEIKSINSNGFNYVMSQQTPKLAHQLQIAAYFLATDIERFSVIYENKDTQDYKEIVFPRSPGAVTAARTDLEKIVDKTVHEELCEIKDLCWAKQGSEYLQCPYRSVCLEIKNWAHAVEKSSESTSAVTSTSATQVSTLTSPTSPTEKPTSSKEADSTPGSRSKLRLPRMSSSDDA